MFTDMVGSTAAAQTNEAEALRLRDEQEELVRPLFAAHQGREVKSIGDGFLAEFDSALRALQCAIDIQQHLHERNSQQGVVPVHLRIGVHLGDVEQRGTDIFGDAVNIASRIEPIAPPGGVCISGEVANQIRNKIPNQLEKLPPTALKGIQGPIEVYRVVLPWARQEPPTKSPGPPGIAVLPFSNISPDPKDEYFAEGLTEELITVLSQLKGLRVIARTSVMPYKSTGKGVAQIGAELRVASILEGSVRKSGNRLRVTAQLIEVESESHVWSQSFDRDLDDVFAVQAEIAKQVTDALKIELRPVEEARLEARLPVRPDSYLAYLKGRALHNSFAKETVAAARKQFELAISLDPRNAAAYVGLADVTSDYRQIQPDSDWKARKRRLVLQALEIDPNLAEAHASLAQIYLDEGQFDAADKEYKLSLSLNPSYSWAHHWYAERLSDQGRVDEALLEWALAEGADPLAPSHLEHYSQLLVWLGRLDEAQVKLQKLGELEPDSEGYHSVLFDYYLGRGDLEQALKEQRRCEELETNPRWKPFYRAIYHALSGEKEQARAILRHEESLPELPNVGWSFVWAYCELGDLDDCFRWLDKLASPRFVYSRGFRLDPRLDPIRKDPRFPASIKKLGLD